MTNSEFSDKDLEKLLATLTVDPVRVDLKDEILSANAKVQRTNTERFNWRSIAASLVAVGVLGIGGLSYTQSVAEQNEQAALQLAAEDMGMDDIFDWVYGDG